MYKNKYDATDILTLGVHQPTNAEVFAANHLLMPIASILRRRRLTFAGHCYRCFESAPQPIMDVLFFSMKDSQSREPEQLQEAAE